MFSLVRHWVGMPVLAAGAAAVLLVAGSYSGRRDGISDLITRADSGVQTAQAEQPAANSPAAAPQTAAPTADAKDADAGHEQAQRLMKAVDAILQDAAKNRGEARKLPAESDFILRPLWTETREDRERRIRDLLDSALGVVTDVPIVELQKKIEGLRKNIRELDDRSVPLAREAARRPQGRRAARPRHRHGRQPRQGHRRHQEAHRAQPRRDRQDQGRGARSAQEGRRAALARAGRPAARQRAVGRPGAPRRRLQLGQADRRPARQADDRLGREHRRRAQVLRHARGPVRDAGARPGHDHRQDRQPVPAASSPPSRSTSAPRAPRRPSC